MLEELQERTEERPACLPCLCGARPVAVSCGAGRYSGQCEHRITGARWVWWRSPAESIVGTKTSGRHTAFAPNFMPILGESTEFAAKWSSLCDAHLKEGIRDPIVAYEYMNHYYIQEGNKRVSVLKYFDAISIPGYVTRIIPAREDTPEAVFTTNS